MKNENKKQKQSQSARCGKKNRWPTQFCHADCGNCFAIHNRQFSLLVNVLKEVYGEEVVDVVESVCPFFSVCADCHYDGMSHNSKCEISAAAENHVRKLCAENLNVAAVKAVMSSVAAYGRAVSALEYRSLAKEGK